MEISYAGDEIQKITEFDSAGGYKSRVELEYDGSELSKVSTFRGDSLLGYSTFQYSTSAIAYVSERNHCSHISIQQISDRIIIQSPLTQVAKISLFSIAGSKLCTVFQGKLLAGRNEIAIKGNFPTAKYLLVNESAGGKYVGSFIKK